MDKKNALDDLGSNAPDINTASNKRGEVSVNDTIEKPPSNNNEGNSALTINTMQGRVMNNTDTDIRPIPFYKSISATIAVVLLFWRPLFAVLLPGWMYTSNISEVFLFRSCIRWSMQTLLISCLLELLVATVFLKYFVVPAIFSVESWTAFDHLKRRKLIGYFVKIIVSTSCFMELTILVAPQLDLDEGLYRKFNVGEANMKLERNHTAITCQEAEMTLNDAVSMRAWYTLRNNIMAVMIWELCFIPELPLVTWLHHLAVIIPTCFLTESHVMANRADVQPLLDSLSIFACFDTFMGNLCNIFILMYHLNNKRPQRQVVLMQLSALIQSIALLVTIIIFPLTVLIRKFENFGDLGWGLLMSFLAAAMIEFRFVWVTMSVAKHARKKTAALPMSTHNTLNDVHALDQLCNHM